MRGFPSILIFCTVSASASPFFSLFSLSPPCTHTPSIAERDLMKSFPRRFGWGGISLHCATPLRFFLFFFHSPSLTKALEGRVETAIGTTQGEAAFSTLSPVVTVFFFFFSLPISARLSSSRSSGADDRTRITRGLPARDTLEKKTRRPGIIRDRWHKRGKKRRPKSENKREKKREREREGGWNTKQVLMKEITRVSPRIISYRVHSIFAIALLFFFCNCMLVSTRRGGPTTISDIFVTVGRP